ncbi:hypothetical protein BCR36DRAFT_406899 [Piromyces finnis]|uniref:WAP domain-containing protein n=1 Tax=Piromyces finnis TaxID=1754191 RepID=A0A1Y1UXG7_9FUNG|nr:hypothetical protein BCR36DRAFT_406899 [Piromyces finnis]|eukprot:ORX42959.1 hypothetical protein BCR36DRAFT_406899 [Piromyces finnis]
MFLLLITLISLFINSGYSFTDEATGSKFYETNFLISDLKKLKIKECNSLDDCPEYSTACSIGDDGKSYCDFKFYCRTNYACFLEIPDEISNEIIPRIKELDRNETISHSFSVDVEQEYKKDFSMGTETSLKMKSSLEQSSQCYMFCKKDSDCYSELCKGDCCIANSNIEELICTPNKKEPTSKGVICKLSNNQKCSKDENCYSNCCDYSGVCLDDYNSNEKKKFDNEVNIFYVFIMLIILLITSVLFCSFYFGRKVNKPLKGKRKHILDD